MKRISAHTGRKSPALVVSLLALAACFSGCAVVGERYTLEEQFTRKQVQAIRDGETTRKDVLDLFGPPLAVARPGAVVKIPRPGLVTNGSRDVPAESVFSRFPEAAGRAGLAVYYYRGSALVWADLFIYNAGVPTTPTLEVTDLWVLIDEKRGRVAGHQMETTEWETCGLWIWCRDDEGLRPKKGPGENAGTPKGSAMPWEGAP